MSKYNFTDRDKYAIKWYICGILVFIAGLSGYMIGLKG